MKNFSTYQRNIIINKFFLKYLKIKRKNNDCVWIFFGGLLFLFIATGLAATRSQHT